MRLIGRFAVLAAALVLTCGPAQAQTKLKWAHVYETSEPYHTWSVWAAGEIEKRTNGKYHVDVFPASSLGKESDINQGMTLGTVDMIISGLSFAARTMPRIGVGYYPYTFRDGDHLIKYSQSAVFKDMVDEYRTKTGIQITAMTYYGARHTTSNKPFTDCAGMKGLKIRVPDVPAYLALPKSCGANPTPIAFAEVYLNVFVNGQAEFATGQFVSGNFYSALGVPAAVGRTVSVQRAHLRFCIQLLWRTRARHRRHRPIRIDVLQRREPHQRNRHPDGAWRGA